jgi:O-antigen/teichoic acid export membrane protein
MSRIFRLRAVISERWLASDIKDKEVIEIQKKQQPLDLQEMAVEVEIQDLTRGSLLARNTVWNLLGQVAPMGVALFAIPMLIRHIGTDRFGILTIAWMVVGYFSLFDLGLGRAMTNLVAQHLGGDRQDELPAIVWTANGVMAVMGIVGAIALAAVSPLFTHSLLKIPPSLQTETLHSLLLLSISVPLVISTAGFRGILEAQQKFGLLNIVKIPMGVATFLAPVAVLPFTNNLTALIGALVFARVIFLIAYIFLALREMPTLRHQFAFDKVLLRPLFSFGGWMTVSNVVSPLMVYVDRFLIGSLLSITAVAYYATPYEVATKLLIVPGALVGVLFPAFSTAMATNRIRGALLYRRAAKYVGLFLFPLSFVLIVFSQNILQLWLGHEFSVHSTRVLQILSLGVFANGLAFIPFALIQGAGRADITGKLHLLELPFYLVSVWVLTRHFGIEGTAIAWTIRMIADVILMFWAAGRFVDKFARFKYLIPVAAGVTAVFALGMVGMSLPEKILVSAIVLLSFAATAWFALLAAEERTSIQRLKTRLLPSLLRQKPMGA